MDWMNRSETNKRVKGHLGSLVWSITLSVIVIILIIKLIIIIVMSSVHPIAPSIWLMMLLLICVLVVMMSHGIESPVPLLLLMFWMMIGHDYRRTAPRIGIVVLWLWCRILMRILLLLMVHWFMDWGLVLSRMPSWSTI